MTTLFIILLSAWILVSLFVFVWVWTKRIRLEKFFDRRIYRRVMNLGRKYDYIVINDILLTVDNVSYVADYFIIADKFCYCIKTVNKTGCLSGELSDQAWKLDSTKGKMTMVNNYLAENKQNALTFEMILQHRIVEDCQFIIPVVVVPNELVIDPRLKSEYQHSYMFKFKDLKKGIRAIEQKSTVSPMSDDTIKKIKDKMLGFSQVKKKKQKKRMRRKQNDTSYNQYEMHGMRKQHKGCIGEELHRS